MTAHDDDITPPEDLAETLELNEELLEDEDGVVKAKTDDEVLDSEEGASLGLE
jgi:hypothetical protein